MNISIRILGTEVLGISLGDEGVYLDADALELLSGDGDVTSIPFGFGAPEDEEGQEDEE